MAETTTKVCTVCKKELPVTLEFFTRRTDSRDGFNYVCKDCKHKYNQENTAHCRQYSKEWRQNNLQYAREKDKQYRLNNPGKVREKDKRNWCENKEKIQQRRRENNTSHKYWEKNKERLKEQSRTYRKSHLPNILININKRRARKRQLLSNYSLPEWEFAKSYFNNKCAYCGKKVKLSQDHFIPVDKDGEYTINNIIPACMSCNISKNSKDFFDWYPKQKFYSKRRETKILKYLNYKDGVQQLQLIEVGG